MNFLAQKLKERSDFITKNASVEDQKELLEDLISLGSAMQAAGVTTQQEYKDFFYIFNHVGNIVKKITQSSFDDESLSKISHIVFVNRKEFPINTIDNFHKAVKNALDNDEISITKKAYPQAFENHFIRAPHNFSKWVEGMRQIYAYRQRGYDSEKSFDMVTNNWDEMEKKDFSHWMNFYQSRGHAAYKTAQFGRREEGQRYYDPGEGQGVIPYAALKAHLPNVGGPMNAEDGKLFEIERKQQSAAQTEKEKQNEIADKMSKLIARLNSAEKIFAGADLQKILGNEYEEWLDNLHKLKRIIYSKQPKTASTIRDIMICQGNKLRSNGCYKSGKLMNILATWQFEMMNSFDQALSLPFYKHAQAAPPSVDEAAPEGQPGAVEEPLEAGDSVEDPTEGDPMADLAGGDMGMEGLDSDMPDDPGKDHTDPEGAMLAFLDNLGGDIKEASFEDDGASIIVAEDGFYRFAQEAPVDPPMPPARNVPSSAAAPAAGNTGIPGLSSRERHVPDADSGDANKGDSAIDAALKNVQLPDVIAKLEELVQFHRNRQMSRELLIVDLMLEALGISAFFPSMAEASKSSLDSNQYVLTRLEDVLAKLRGAAAVQDGSLDALKDKLDQQVKNETQRREDKQKAEMEPLQPTPIEGGPPTPGVPAPEQELAQPAQIQPTPQPAPIR